MSFYKKKKMRVSNQNYVAIPARTILLNNITIELSFRTTLKHNSTQALDLTRRKVYFVYNF